MDSGSPTIFGLSIEMIIAGIIIFVSIVLIALLIKFYPAMQSMEHETEIEVEAEDQPRIATPMTEVFLNYKHKNAVDWAKWMNQQSEDMRDQAFAKIRVFLAKNPDKVGLLARDVLKAVRILNHPEIYDLVADFMVKLRQSWGRFKHVESLYEHCTGTLVEVNKHKSFETLRTSLIYLKQKKMPRRLLDF